MKERRLKKQDSKEDSKVENRVSTFVVLGVINTEIFECH